MSRHHRGVDNRQHLSGLSADHGEAENAVVALPNESLHEALGLARRLRAQHRFHRQLGDARLDAPTLGFTLAQAHMRERRIGEHAIRNEPVACAALPAG